MLGIKFLHLLNELKAAQINELKIRCSAHKDKRYYILLHLLDLDLTNSDLILDELKNQIEFYWPNSEDNALKFRRMTVFYSKLFESLIIESYLKKESALKSELLSKAVEKSGNLLLINHYYNKAYAEGAKHDDKSTHISGLNGKLRMSYASHNEKDLENALHWNEELLDLLNKDYQHKLCDYYYNSSNIYLEQNELIGARKVDFCQAIDANLTIIKEPKLRASLFLSLAKFNYDNEGFSNFLKLSIHELEKSETQDKHYWDLNRKIKFLELRLHFFAGTDLNQLIDLSNDVVDEFQHYSIINNNVFFYKILFLILNGNIAIARNLLEEGNIYFQGDSAILKQFLVALLNERIGESKKAFQLLNNLIYSDNFYVSVFSRLLYIRILLRRDSGALLKRTILSTTRLLKKNQNNPLGKTAHEAVLAYFKKCSRSTKPVVFKESQPLTVLHHYLVSGN